MRIVNNKLAITGTLCLLLILIVSCGSPIKEPVSSLSATESSSFSATTIAANEADPKAALITEINQRLELDSHNQARLINIVYSKPEKGDITVTWAIDDKESQILTCDGAKKDAVAILEAMAETNARFIYVELIGLYDWEDSAGKVYQITAMNLGINKSTLEKVNWEHFQPLGIYDLADVKEIHPWFQ